MREKRKTLDRKDKNLKFKKLAKKQKLQERGITLIALVVTIVILLILSGVTLNIALSDNGLFDKTKKAAEEYKTATDEEQRQIAMAEAAMNTKNTEYRGVTIPAGMAPTKIEGESTIKEGLVAIDINGNEWVWIEVPKSAMPTDLSFINETGYSKEDEENCNKLTEQLKQYAAAYRDNVHNDEYHEGCGLEEYEYNENYQKMLKSVYKNGGFWIGRYEAGIEGSKGIDKESLDLGRTESNKGTTKEKAICQQDAIPYNFITVSEAQKLASEMTPNSGKTSSLMFGIQWDLICKYLEENSDLKEKDLKEDSRSWGNYTGQTVEINSKNAKQYRCDTDRKWSIITGKVESNSVTLLSAGASNMTKKLNIYDLAGNEWELTLEFSDINISRRNDVFDERGNGGI